MIKSKFLIETNDLNGDLLLCNLLYKTKMKIKKEDKNTIDVYFGNEKIDYNEKLKMFIDNGIFIEETTDEIELVKKAKEIAIKNRNQVLNITIKPTISCNLSCIYCWQKEDSGVMSEEVIEKLIKFIEIKASEVKKIVIDWFGGEPMLMYPTIIKVMSAVSNISKRYHIPYVGIMSTNGTLLSSEKLNQLLLYHVYSFQITIDGDKELHNKCRPCKDKALSSYDLIVNNLMDIRDNIKQNYLEIVIRVNVTKEFLESKNDFITFYKKEFSQDKRFSLLLEDVTDKGGEKIKNYADDIISKDVSRDELVEELLQEDIIQHNFNNYDHGSMMCNTLLENSFNINYDGTIYMCELLSDKSNTNSNNNLCVINDDGSLTINDDVKKYWEKVEHTSDCEECVLLPLCFGGLCPLNLKRTSKCHYNNNIETIKNSLRMLSKENRLPILSVVEEQDDK